MATLLSSQTSDATGSAVSHTGPCTVHVAGSFDGALIVLEHSPDTTSANFVSVNRGLSADGSFRYPAVVTLDAQGTYYLRAVQKESGASTSLTVTTLQ